MSTPSTATERSQPLLNVPANPIAYLAVLAAVVSGVIHLLLAPRVMSFDQTIGVLFYLNGLGFLSGIVLFVTRYWRRELYLVAVVYALLTIVAFFVVGGQVNALSVASKVSEAALALAAAYLYRTHTDA